MTWINGEVYPSLSKVEEIATYLGISLHDLVDDGDVKIITFTPIQVKEIPSTSMQQRKKKDIFKIVALSLGILLRLDF